MKYRKEDQKTVVRVVLCFCSKIKHYYGDISTNVYITNIIKSRGMRYWDGLVYNCYHGGRIALKFGSSSILFFLMFICFWERQRRSMSRGGAERAGDIESEAGSRLRAVSKEPDVGLELTNREIMTWAKIGHLTNWATQVPQKLGISKVRQGRFSRLSVRLQLRSWSWGLWVQAQRGALCWQLRTWSLFLILCLPLCPCPGHTHTLSLSKIKINIIIIIIIKLGKGEALRVREKMFFEVENPSCGQSLKRKGVYLSN